jgi:hypothetical protein
VASGVEFAESNGETTEVDMTKELLLEKYPNASPDFIRLNSEPEPAAVDRRGRDRRSAAKLERDSSDGDVAALQSQTALGGRFLVKIKSYRKRLLDEDNLCCKYIVDLLRYAGIISSDAPGTAKIEVSQEKVGPKEPERIRIEVFKV